MDFLETELRIGRLNQEYARCIDEDRLESWVDFFVGEDARYLIHPRENADAGLEGYWMHCENKPMMRDRIVASAQGEHLQHPLRPTYRRR